MTSLISPGVSVTVTDQTQYASTAAGTIPFIVVATAENKHNASGTLAAYTTSATAGQTFIISSQRELVQFYGTPTFQVDASGNPLNADERNEYGLMAAYSALGVGSQVVIQRADVDLSELVGTSIRPTSTPSNGSTWLDLNNTDYGMYAWSNEDGFASISPYPISSVTQLNGAAPSNSIGAIGDYAVVTYSTSNPVYLKRYDNTWAAVGSDNWMQSVPATTGYIVNASNLAIGQHFTINSSNVTMTGTTITQAAIDITAAAIQGVVATVSPLGQLEIRINSLSAASGNIHIPTGTVTIAVGTGADAARNLGIISPLVSTTTFAAPAIAYDTYINTPAWRSTDATPKPDGSIWLKTTAIGNGANWGIKQYNSTLNTWQLQAAPLYDSDSDAIAALDSVGGGSQLAVGTIYVKYDTLNINETANPQLTFMPFIKEIAGALTISGKIPTVPLVFVNNDAFRITVSVPGGGNDSDVSATATIQGTTATAFVQAVQATRLPNLSAMISATGAITIGHLAGGTVRFDYITGTPLVTAGITAGTQASCAQNIQMLVANATYLASPFVPLQYIQSTATPFSNPVDGTLWYYSNPTDVDIMINDGTGWKGYQNVINDARGFNLSATDPMGVIFSDGSAPVAQSDNTPLVSGDLWIDTGDLTNFPMLYRYDVSTKWSLIDNTDDISSNGIVFLDARWANNGTTNPITDAPTPTSTLLQSNYLDPDAPNYQLYPRGALLFNTRRSGFNVKQFESTAFASANIVPTVISTWISHSGENGATGVPFFGFKAQRNTVVKAMKAAVESSTALREEQLLFTLMAAPGYPELIQDLVTLNDDRLQTAFIIGDSPLDLDSSSQSLSTWSSNQRLALDNGEDGLVSHDDYLAVYYPSGYTTDLAGNYIVVPPSHMALRTYIRSDNVSYPWFAPAGVNRGTVDNATSIGFVDRNNNNTFTSIGVTNSLRDILYANSVNPITVLPGTGLVVYGQKTRDPISESLNRVNVARLVCYLRTVLNRAALPYIFEPNDTITRKQVTQVFTQILNSLITTRGITDYSVVCDTSNNTAATIQQNELWIDIAIVPMYAIEFVYIPVRLVNPGSLSSK